MIINFTDGSTLVGNYITIDYNTLIVDDVYRVPINEVESIEEEQTNNQPPKKNKGENKKMTNTELLKSIGAYEDVAEFFEENDIDTSIDEAKPKELIDAWLSWNGVVGYTDCIIELISVFLPDVEPIDFEI